MSKRLHISSAASEVTMISPARRRTVRILAGCSFAFGVLAMICAMIFHLSPKHGIAVVAAYSMLACIAMSVIGVVFGIAAFVAGTGVSRVAFTGLIFCAIPLVYLLVFCWDDLWGERDRTVTPRPQEQAAPVTR